LTREGITSPDCLNWWFGLFYFGVFRMNRSGMMPTLYDREDYTGPDRWEGEHNEPLPSARETMARNRYSDRDFARQMQMADWMTRMAGRKRHYRMQDGMSKNEIAWGLSRIHGLKADERKLREEETGEKLKYWTQKRPNDLTKRGYVDRWGFSV